MCCCCPNPKPGLPDQNVRMVCFLFSPGIPHKLYGGEQVRCPNSTSMQTTDEILKQRVQTLNHKFNYQRTPGKPPLCHSRPLNQQQQHGEHSKVPRKKCDKAMRGDNYSHTARRRNQARFLHTQRSPCLGSRGMQRGKADRQSHGRHTMGPQGPHSRLSSLGMQRGRWTALRRRTPLRAALMLRGPAARVDQLHFAVLVVPSARPCAHTHVHHRGWTTLREAKPRAPATRVLALLK
jgi:hypothetical protein